MASRYQNLDGYGNPPPPPYKNVVTESVQMREGLHTPTSSYHVPQNEYGRDSYARHPWYDVRHWSRKILAAVVVALLVIIAVVVAVAVVETKKNAYPNYAQISYSLLDTYSGTTFFDNFDYFTGYDPTAGFVHYMLYDQQLPYNLTYASNSSAVVRVDNTQPNQTTGRYSVRLTSKKAYDTGLFIFDVMHTPYGCGTWPALWTTNANLASWPSSGEIDVMEAINQATSGNQMTLHTTEGCTMNVKREETGSSLTTDCYNGTDSNAGCGVSGAASTFGSAFNANGGGIMAMELRNAGIRMWQFGRSSIPADITFKTPDPSTWGTALADFPSTSCNIGNHFNNQSIIIDIDLCGSWAGATGVYTTLDACPGTCSDYVANNPSAMDNAYWQFGSFWVYQSSQA